jgi:hypothetical protein
MFCSGDPFLPRGLLNIFLSGDPFLSRGPLKPLPRKPRPLSTNSDLICCNDQALFYMWREEWNPRQRGHPSTTGITFARNNRTSSQDLFKPRSFHKVRASLVTSMSNRRHLRQPHPCAAAQPAAGGGAAFAAAGGEGDAEDAPPGQDPRRCGGPCC